MSSLITSFILAYHGCDQSVADQLVEGAAFKESRNGYDWLGPGIYEKTHIQIAVCTPDCIQSVFRVQPRFLH